jgi:lysophospholipase L1-like esterase
MATQSVILGASNYTRLVFENPNVHNISVSGTTLDQVQQLLDKSDSQVDSENVDSVVLSLGTNDVTQYRNDTEQIIVNVTTCVLDTGNFVIDRLGIRMFVTCKQST